MDILNLLPKSLHA